MLFGKIQNISKIYDNSCRVKKELYQQFSTTISFKGSILICFKFYGHKKCNSAYTSNFVLFSWRSSLWWVRTSLFSRLYDHTQTHTLGGTPQNEWLVQCRDLYLTTHNTHDIHPYPRRVSNSNPASERPQIHERFSQTLLNHPGRRGLNSKYCSRLMDCI
jgi:hypothetical protein